MSVMVTGGTGFYRKPHHPKLVERGEEVSALTWLRRARTCSRCSTAYPSIGAM